MEEGVENVSFIEIKDVVKRYGRDISVDHLSLNIEEGEIFGLLGPNGAGKSTTIKMLTGLLNMDQGEIKVGGISVAQHPIQVKKSLGLVPQELAIYESLTARENVVFFGKLYGLRGKLLEERVDESLEFVGLVDRQREKPKNYSGGMKRRLNIACAIMHRPRLIIMDEPTVGIDPQSRNHILESVKQLNQMGSTIIYTSHYMEEVAAISTRVGIMDNGRLITSGTQSELRKMMSKEEKLVIEVELVHASAIEELKNHSRLNKVHVLENTIEIYLESSQAYLQDILFILSKHEVVIQSLTRVEADLETLFLSLTGRTLRD
jgi:ABC-2 type transport system ATP-binding protein